MALIAQGLSIVLLVIALLLRFRTTVDQTRLGTRIDKSDLMPGDLVFFKTGSGENGLHVGIYDTDNTFIHASTSKGVMRSSMDNSYWRKVFWQARRI